MTSPHLFLAQLDLGQPRPPWDGLTLKSLMMPGALGLVTLLLLCWAAFFRKRRRQHSHRHHHHHPRSSGQFESSGADAGQGQEGQRKRRRRRRRREHRPRNPTLAETGGLPPVRTDKPAEPLP
jgi:hypothetical protein